MRNVLYFIIALLFSVGCSTGDIPPAHKGMLYNRTGFFAFYSGGGGLMGPVLEPGTHYLGVYNELRIVECSQVTIKEPLTALTKDGIQFSLDVYVTFSIDCSNEQIEKLLKTLAPAGKDSMITATQVYETYIRPNIGQAVRTNVSPERANDINDRREIILAQIHKSFVSGMKAQEQNFVQLQQLVLSNLGFPTEMNEANTQRAVQGVLKDKSIAERERIDAEIETMKKSKALQQSEGDALAGKIDKIGEALRRNPEYLQYDLQQKMPGIYEKAGSQGNLIIAAPSPALQMLQKKGVVLPATQPTP